METPKNNGAIHVNMAMSNRTAKALRLTLFSDHLVLSAMLPQLALADGDSGISVMPEAPNLFRTKLLTQSNGSLIDLIRSGRNMMPAYLGILNGREILSVINYVRCFH